jgi:hypothetical protein
VTNANATDLWKLITNAERDLDNCRTKLTELRTHLSAMNLPPAKPKPVCPECGPITLPRNVTINDHLRNVHDTEPA